MTQKNLTIRVENLESAVVELVRLPRQIEDLSSQFLQLREDVREEISGVHSAMSTMCDELRGEVTTTRNELRREMTTMQDALRGEMTTMQHALRGEITTMRDELRGEITTMRDELRGDVEQVQMELAGSILSTEKRLSTQTRSLHEDLVQRIALIGEARPVVEGSGATSPVRPPRSRKKR
jgi:hypothetical protein